MDEEMLITEAVFGRKPVKETGASRPVTSGPGKYSGREGKKRHVKRKSLLSKIFLWLFLVFLLASLLLGAYLFIKRDEIKQLFVDEINTYLKTPIATQDVKIGLWNPWPMISVSFKGVSSYGTETEDEEILFQAESLSFSFSLKDLYHKQYVVREIVVSGGDFNLKHYGEGVYNYLIWKKISNPERPLRFHLRRIVLRNTLVRFRDLPARHDFQVLFRNVSARGELYERGQAFALKGNIDVHSMKAGGFVFLGKQKANIELQFVNNQETREFVLEKGLVGLGNSRFSTQGRVHYQRKAPFLKFRFQGKSLRVEDLLGLLPAEAREPLVDYKIRGNLSFDMEIEGDYTRSPLSFSTRFHYSKGKVKHEPSGVEASGIEMAGSFSNGGKLGLAQAGFHLDRLETVFPSGSIKGRFDLKGFEQPDMTYEGVVDLDLSDLQRFLGLWPGTSLQADVQGKIAIRNRFPSLHVRSWKPEDFSGMEARGRLDLRNVEVALPGKPLLQSDSLSLFFDSKALKTNTFLLRSLPNQETRHASRPASGLSFSGKRAESLAGSVPPGQEMNLRLFIGNFFPCLWIPGQDLYLTADLKSDFLDWNSLKIWFEPKGDTLSGPRREESAEEREESGEIFRRKAFSGDLYADVELKAACFRLPQTDVEKLKTLLRVSPSGLRLEDLHAEAFQGSFDGVVDLGLQAGLWQVSLQGLLQQLDMAACFQAFEDFGLKNFGHENLSGNLSADLGLAFDYRTEEKRLLPESLVLKADLSLQDGVLQDLPALEKLSRFTGENDLQKIRFADLRNEIEIRDQVVYLPWMDIVSDVANFSLCGKHGFDNQVEYLVDIELSELLGKRRRQRMKAGREEEFGVVSSSGSRVMLPLEIKGKLPDVELKYAFGLAKKGAKARLQEHRREMKAELEREYGARRSIQKARKEERRKQEEQRWLQEQGGFVLDRSGLGLLDSGSGLEAVPGAGVRPGLDAGSASADFRTLPSDSLLQADSLQQRISRSKEEKFSLPGKSIGDTSEREYRTEEDFRIGFEDD